MDKYNKTITRFPPVLSGFFVGIIIMLTGLFIAYSQYQIIVTDNEIETRGVLEILDQNLQYTIREINSIALLLSQTVDENGEVQNFDQVAAELIEKYPTVNVLEIIEDGIVTHIYPYEGYESILGFNLYQNERIRRELLRSAESQSIYFSGPTMLQEGRLGVVGLYPFSVADKMKISTVILYLDVLVEQAQITAFSDRYDFQLSKINPVTGIEEFFLGDGEELKGEHISYVEITEGAWKLYASKKEGSRATLMFIIITGFSIFGSMLSGYFSYQFFLKPYELEDLLEEKSRELVVSREQFKQNSELLSSVLESPRRMSIFSLDTEYNYIAFNENHRDFIENEFDVNIDVGVNIFSFVSEDEKAKVKARYDRALNGESFEYIRKSVTKNGPMMYWQNWYNPIKDKNRKIIGITVFSVDITHNLKAERELEQNEKRYRTLISSSPFCIHELDSQGKLISINEAGLKMFDKEREEELLGLAYASLVGKKNQKTVDEAISEALSGESIEFEIQSKTQHFLSAFIPLKNEQGEVIKIMGITQDITERKKAEDFIEVSLKEKTTLLAEIHHRVKNNLAIVSGLLELQKAEVKDDFLTSAFDQSINRIISIAMVHELMYNTQDLSSVNVHSYLDKLIPAISATMQNKAQNVEFDIDVDEYRLNINQAIPLGLLLNELITNSFKYAFEGEVGNKITIHLTGIKNNLLVHYADNGKGFSPEVDFEEPKNLGLNLIHAQLAQLDANYEANTDSKFQLNFTFRMQRKGSHSNIRQ